jgi:hypothetical protein
VRLTLCLVGGLICLLVVAGAWTGIFRFGKGGSDETAAGLTGQIEKLQEQLRQKDLALSVYEKRLKEIQETPTLAAIGPRSPVDPSGSRIETSAENDGPLMAIQDSTKSETTAGVVAGVAPDEPAKKPVDVQRKTSSRKEAAVQRDDSSGRTPGRQSRGTQRSPAVSFDAQSVVAVAKSPNSGVLKFQLVKDEHEIPFSGYLFVFVEMADPKGENAIYAYPKKTRLGEEDLPANFRDGEPLSFKINQRVELPYADSRSGVSLDRVSILLYSDEGKIVFQRGFDRKEVKVLDAKEADHENARPRAGVEKRRAL